METGIEANDLAIVELSEEIAGMKGNGTGGSPDWNAAVNENGHILNRTHWSEEVTLSPITFDNDLTNREFLRPCWANDSTDYFVKISSDKIDPNLFVGKILTETYPDGSSYDIELEFPDEEDQIIIDNENAMYRFYYNELLVVHGQVNYDGGTYTEGIYLYGYENDFYVSAISDVLVHVENIHKIDRKYLPIEHLKNHYLSIGQPQYIGEYQQEIARENISAVSYNEIKSIVTGDFSNDYATFKKIFDDQITELNSALLFKFPKNYVLFENNQKLTKVNLPHIEEIKAGIFSGCSNLQEIKLPNVKTIGSRAFAGTGLISVELPCLQTVDYEAFSGCSQLTHVNMPSVVSIEAQAFRGCNNLSTIDLTSIKTIKHSIIENCNGTSLIIIIRNANEVCTLEMYLGGNVETIYIYVPRNLLEDYKKASGWSQYAESFRALEDYTVDGTITGKLDESKI